MMNNNQTLLIVVGIVSTATLLMVGACLFFIGYFIGKQSAVGVSSSIIKTNKANSSIILKDKISIDETKIVTEISTDGLEKKYDTLGETKQSNENITNSINKLKNMKR